MSDLGNKNLISLEAATKFCNYSQEYLSLRARRKKLRAVKIGRAWMTTKEWIEEYLKKVDEYKYILDQKRSRSVIEEKKEEPALIEIIEGNREPVISSIAQAMKRTTKNSSFREVENIPFVENKIAVKNIAFNNLNTEKTENHKTVVDDYPSYAYDKKHFLNNYKLLLFSGFCFIILLIFAGAVVIKPVNMTSNNISADIGNVVKGSPNLDRYLSNLACSMGYTKNTFSQYFLWLGQEIKNKASYADKTLSHSLAFFAGPFVFFSDYVESVITQKNGYTADSSLDSVLKNEINNIKKEIAEIKDNISSEDSSLDNNMNAGD
jgi:hypothetical protein